MRIDFYAQVPLVLWVFILAMAGGLIGAWVQRVALGYRRVLLQGGNVDAWSLSQALIQSLSPTTTLASDSGPAKTCGLRFIPNGVRRLEPGFAISACTMAAGMVGLYLQHGLSPYFFLSALAGIMLLMLAMIDAQTGLLPDALTLPLLWAGLAVSWSGLGVPLPEAVGGVFLGYGFLWAVVNIFRLWRRIDGMGGGDLKMLGALGAWTGWHALPWILLGACLLGVAFAMSSQKSWRPSGAIPFGPFLAVSAAGVFLFGSAVHSWF